jgi:hypothetical protein
VLSEAITCTLKHVKLSDYLQHEALSYEWGLKLARTTRLNKEDCNVRESRFENSDTITELRILCVDAVSINQSDVSEYSHQVSVPDESELQES